MWGGRRLRGRRTWPRVATTAQRNAAVAKAYLEYLYSDEGQSIAGRHYFRPRSEAVLAKYSSQFAKLTLFTVDEAFGGWKNAQKAHFNDGGTFDQIFKP